MAKDTKKGWQMIQNRGWQMYGWQIYAHPYESFVETLLMRLWLMMIPTQY